MGFWLLDALYNQIGCFETALSGLQIVVMVIAALTMSDLKEPSGTASMTAAPHR